MSIAVLRAFIAKRKLEHEAMLSKRMKAVAKVSDKPVDKTEAPVESISEAEKSNGRYEASEEASEHEPCSTSEKLVDNIEEKSRGGLKPPRVLEVSENSSFNLSCALYFISFQKRKGLQYCISQKLICFNRLCQLLV